MTVDLRLGDMKPECLDLYCGAGGCTKGYQDAGFRVTGVDIRPQPHYCGDEFYQMDVFEFLATHDISRYALIHSSPPCQGYSMAAQQWRIQGKEYPDLIDATRKALQATGKPYVIENVPGAPLINPTVLNGAYFGKNLRRTRWFETSFPMPFILLPKERRSNFKMGRPPKDSDPVVPVGHFSNVERARRVMECPWMVQGELAQAVPPFMTELIGRQFLSINACSISVG